MFGNRLSSENDKNALHNIIETQMRQLWPKAELKDVRDVFFVPSTTSHNVNQSVKLCKSTAEEWVASIKKGIRYIGKNFYAETLNVFEYRHNN